MIKLIATDMDGTFLDSNKMFDYDFISLFYKLQELDIKFVIASGNQFFRLYHQFIPMSNQMYFIADNGAYIGQGEQVFNVSTLSKDQVHQILDITLPMNDLVTVCSGRKGVHLLKKDEQYKDFLHNYYRNVMIEDSLYDLDDEILKLSIYNPDNNIEKYAPIVSNQLSEDLHLMTSGNEWMDIQLKGINKGYAIKYLQEKLDIKKEECVAFGDAMNDASMLETVKYSYAMNNADERIKDLAYRKTDSNDNYGVTRIIRQIVNDKFEY